jgi:hypothetical protein
MARPGAARWLDQNHVGAHFSGNLSAQLPGFIAEVANLVWGKHGSSAASTRGRASKNYRVIQSHRILGPMRPIVKARVKFWGIWHSSSKSGGEGSERKSKPRRSVAGRFASARPITEKSSNG